MCNARIPQDYLLRVFLRRMLILLLRVFLLFRVLLPPAVLSGSLQMAYK